MGWERRDWAQFSVTFESGMSTDFPKPGPEMPALQNPASYELMVPAACEAVGFRFGAKTALYFLWRRPLLIHSRQRFW